jgi:hypothetical protein
MDSQIFLRAYLDVLPVFFLPYFLAFTTASRFSVRTHRTEPQPRPESTLAILLSAPSLPLEVTQGSSLGGLQVNARASRMGVCG